MLGATAIIAGIRRLGLRNPPSEEEIMSRKAEIQEFVHKFRKAAKAHEKVYIVSRFEYNVNTNLLGRHRLAGYTWTV